MWSAVYGRVRAYGIHAGLMTVVLASFWVSAEAARLAAPGTAKVVMADAVRAIPNSVTLWLRAAELEGEDRLVDHAHCCTALPIACTLIRVHDVVFGCLIACLQ